MKSWPTPTLLRVQKVLKLGHGVTLVSVPVNKYILVKLNSIKKVSLQWKQVWNPTQSLKAFKFITCPGCVEILAILW